MAKITYLLGAGASANTIPVVKNMQERMIDIRERLFLYYQPETDSFHRAESAYTLLVNNEVLEEIIADFDWLISQAENYYSIDTLAKKFYLTNRNREYERLKKCLIIYLTLEQFIFFNSNDKNDSFRKSKIDKRYDSFIAAVANHSESGLKLNGNIKILTWNYDIQVELSLKRFTNKKIADIKSKYQIFPLLNVQSKDNENKNKAEEFSLIKLNGNAIFTTSQLMRDEDETIFDTDSYDTFSNDTASIDRLVGMFVAEITALKFDDNVACRFLNFAWEGANEFETTLRGRKHQGYERNLTEAESISSDTEILVVIGYSFPIFNREIDNKLFKKMTGLKKVYIQDNDPENIKSTMENAFEVFQNSTQVMDGFQKYKEVPIVKFHLTKNTDQFVIPYELNQ